MGTTRDWSPAEDLRPGHPFAKTQPEVTARGKVWTQIVCLHWPAPCFTQMTITEREDGTIVPDHGRVYQVPSEDDGA